VILYEHVNVFYSLLLNIELLWPILIDVDISFQIDVLIYQYKTWTANYDAVYVIVPKV